LRTEPLLVLLPGLDGTGQLFRPLQDALAPTLRCRIISYPTDRELDLAALGALVSAQLPSSKSVVLAESFSGLVVLALLPGLRARIASVVFVGAFAEPPRPLLLRLSALLSHSGRLMQSAPAFLIRQYCLGDSARAPDLQRLREALARVSPGVLSHRMRLIASRHSFASDNIDVPCHYIRATNDRLVPSSSIDGFRQRFKDLHVHDIDGPHFLLQMKPRECAGVIERIVRLPIRED
jgi:pimeloyl-ACP methyl ester carboxylesterase